jgi:hypothetical protein
MHRLLGFLRQFPPFAWVGNQVHDPVKFRRLNGWLVVFWTVMFPFSIVSGLWTAVAYVSVLSIYANWATHLGVWTSSRAEVAATDDLDIETHHANVKADDVDIEAKHSNLK